MHLLMQSRAEAVRLSLWEAMLCSATRRSACGLQERPALRTGAVLFLQNALRDDWQGQHDDKESSVEWTTAT